MIQLQLPLKADCEWKRLKETFRLEMNRRAHFIAVTALVILLALLIADVLTQDEFDDFEENSSGQADPPLILPLHITSGIPMRVRCPERHFFARGKCHPIFYHGEKKTTLITNSLLRVHGTQRL
jgi:hypothetical protein